MEEVGEQARQPGWGGQFGTGGFDIAVERQDLAFEVAVAPQAEGVAVGIDQVREGLQLFPLFAVVLVGEAPRVRALARRLDLDEAHQRRVERDCVIGPCLQVGKRRLAHRDDLRFLGRPSNSAMS